MGRNRKYPREYNDKGLRVYRHNNEISFGSIVPFETTEKMSSVRAFVSGAAVLGSLESTHMVVPNVRVIKNRSSVWDDVGECFDDAGNKIRVAAVELGLKV